MASAPPAFQFYAQDFYTGTLGMSNEAVGIYIRMLCYQWIHGGIPSNRKTLENFLGISSYKFRKNFAEIAKKFKLGRDKVLRNPRLEEVRRNQQRYSEIQAKRGQRGGHKRHVAASKTGKPALEPKSSSSIFDLQTTLGTEKNAAAPPSPAVENSAAVQKRKDPPSIPVLAAMILRDGILAIDRIPDQAEAAKCRAAQLHLSYSSRAIANALASAQAQAAKHGRRYDS
jgi:uncharacterized protein YdaU (DUF1376 family)